MNARTLPARPIPLTDHERWSDERRRVASGRRAKAFPIFTVLIAVAALAASIALIVCVHA